MAKFKAGDVVMPLPSSGYFAPGETPTEGQVFGYIETSVAVGFRTRRVNGGNHDCNGLVPKDLFGYMFSEPQLSLSAGKVVLTPAAPTAAMPKKASAKKRIFDKDWDLAEKVLNDPKCTRVLFWGPPGTAKTTTMFRWMVKQFTDANVFMTSAHEESTVEELVGHWVPKGAEFVWHDGFAVKAMRSGGLIINEPDRAANSYMSGLHAILDDPEVARIQLPTGEIVRPHAGFKVFASMNGNPDDLHDALRDRFNVKVYIPRPHPEALSVLDDDLFDLVINAYSNPEALAFSYRNAVSFMSLRHTLPLEDAAAMAFGANCKDILASIKLTATKKKVKS